NSGVVAPRDQAIPYGQLAVAQAGSFRREVVGLYGRLPDRLWRLAYGAAGGTWVGAGPRALTRLDLGAEPTEMPFLVGRGWYDAQGEGNVTLRRARGPGARLRRPPRGPPAPPPAGP